MNQAEGRDPSAGKATDKVGTFQSNGMIRTLRRGRWALGGVLMGVFLTGMPVLAQDILTQPVFGRKEHFGIGPRAMGMGGAFTAVADDASAVYWNVAGLAQAYAYEISVSSAPIYFADRIGAAPNDAAGFGFPWYASLQFIIPVAKENTLAISFFRPFHPQRDFFAGNPSISDPDRKNLSYYINPSFQESYIALSYAARFSNVKNFSLGINVKRVTNDPYYIRPFGPYLPAGALDEAVEVTGYGIDLGLLYRIPVTKYSEEFRIGLALNDMVARAAYKEFRLQVPGGPVMVDYNQGGIEIPIPPMITLGLAYKNNFLFKIRNITALDLSQISLADVPDSENKFLRFGTEFWLFKDVLGIRGGYSTPLSRPGTIHLGLSVRALGGNFQADLAYLQPVAEIASFEGDVSAGQVTGGINFEKFHIGASYRFGNAEELPPPKVGAFVRPEAFTPAQGEKAVFHLDTTEDVSINRWSVLIYDPAGDLVRALRGRGTPPTKLQWQGENDLYEPLPPGVYTWAFQVHDQLDHVGSTPVQTVEILAPPRQADAPRDPSRLLALRQQQEALLLQERAQLTALARESLARLLGTAEATPTTAAALAEPYGNTLAPSTDGAPALGFNHVPPDAVLNTHFDRGPGGEPVLVVSYRSNLTYVPYLYNEAAEVIKTAVNSVGTGLKEISTRVYYGKNELSLRTPTQAAANYASGRIDRDTLLSLSDIQINGMKVGPNGY